MKRLQSFILLLLTISFTACSQSNGMIDEENGTTYTVTFNSNGGTGIDAQSVTSGSLVELPDDPTKAGALFLCWCSDSALTTEWDFSSKVTSNITLYAKWDEVFVVSFDSKYGTSIEDQNISVGGVATKPADPTLSNNIFLGWFTTTDCTTRYDFSEVVTSSMVLYANWIEESTDLRKISTAAELKAFRDNIDGGSTNLNAVLLADIDLESEEFGRIGDNVDPYVGAFNGNGYTISNLKSTGQTTPGTPENYTGLFGMIDGGSVKALTLKDVEIKGYNGVGAICGVINNGSIEGCRVIGGTIEGTDCVGGIAGEGSSSNLVNCNNSATIIATDAYTGGIAGGLKTDSGIFGCYNFGTVTGEGVDSELYTGGICGSTTGKIIACYNAGEVYTQGSAAGILGCFIYDAATYESSVMACYYIDYSQDDTAYGAQYELATNPSNFDVDTTQSAPLSSVAELNAAVAEMNVAISSVGLSIRYKLTDLYPTIE